MADDRLAVKVQDAVKSYSKKGPRVLNGLNMNVPRGCIYGLLGASGAGKTTLLSAVVGLLKLDSGVIRVLGGTPGTKGSGVPGPRVGFMPQELALVSEFTVKDAFYYFGLLYGMDIEEINAQHKFLSNLLCLPQKRVLVGNLSGGQSRRLSLAMSLVQTPELLILDEPTVGQDPMLRHSIWEYLMELSEKGNMTIIITTHYIEEARSAHIVGMLRQGTLMAEMSPARLMAQFHCASMEDVALLLSQRQQDSMHATAPHTHDRNHIEMQASTSSAFAQPGMGPDPYEFVSKSPPSKENRRKSSGFQKMKALYFKNMLKIFRNSTGMVFLFMFPLVYTSCFFLGTSGQLKDLDIGIVNDELGDCGSLHDLGPPAIPYPHEDEDEDTTCHYQDVSCAYIALLDTDNKIVPHYFDTVEEALADIRKGDLLSVVHLHRNFSKAMQARQFHPNNIDKKTIAMSEIRIWMDKSDFYKEATIVRHYYESYRNLIRYIAKSCNYSHQYTELPLQIGKPIYGRDDENFSLGMAPGFILAIMVFFANMHTCTTVLLEKVDGVWGRNRVAGVSSTQIFSSHLVTHILLLLVQITETLLISFYIFDVYLLGNFIEMLAILMLQSILGSVFGLTISCVSPSLTAANLMTMGTFLPYSITCGIIWPIEGMPKVLQVICNILPGNYPTRAFLNILYKGYDITHPDVYYGFCSTILWILIFSGISIYFIKTAKH